jgi:alanine-glyoxylate transaminase/serine-glyoxylate transaminase/serine-pyruvate transaminase
MTSTISIKDSQLLQLLPLEVPNRLLLGPAPSNAHPAVLQAMNTTPTIRAS